MRKIILGAVIALTAATSFAAPSQAGSLVLKFGHRHHYHHGWHNGWRVGVYPAYVGCYTKKRAMVDDWGNIYVKRVRICG